MYANDICLFILQELFKMQDKKYKKFQEKLIPTLNPSEIIGVRVPAIRKFLKENSNNNFCKFLKKLPHKYLEENLLHGILISNMKNYKDAVDNLNNFLPYVNNWAVCDLITPFVFKKNTDILLLEIVKWINSQYSYTVRFAIKMLMNFYFGDNFNFNYADMVAGVKTDEYYVKMMIAWYFATALSKNYSGTISYIENKKLDHWVHNKTIQKAIESRRINEIQKNYLKTLKIKV